MNTFNRGDKVLFDNPYACLIGTVSDVQQIGDRTGCVVNFIGADHHDEPSHIWADRLVKLPADAALIPRLTTVHVATDAPRYAGRYGTVHNGELHGRQFGYWLRLTDPDQNAWVPAALLIFKNSGGE